DGGEHWAQQNSGTTADLQAVSFADPTRATAVGLRGTILRTEDGGTTWKEQYSILPNPSLTGVSQKDAQRAYAVGGSKFGAPGTRRTDGGAKWARLAIPCDCDLLGVSFLDADTGTVVGAWGAILTTSSGGVGAATRPVRTRN